MKLLKLFLSFFKIGAFTFGGGYAMISLVQDEFVERKKLVTESEFVDMITIAESTPGPIAINMATFIGKKVGGFLGALIATLGVILPSFIIIFLISLFLDDLLIYAPVVKAFKGIACAVAVIIFFASVKLFKTFKKSLPYIILFALTIIIIALSELKIITFPYITIVIILIAGLIGICSLKLKNNKKDGEKNANPS